MDVTIRDLSVFIYNFAVTVIGGWVAIQIDSTLTDPILLLAMVIVSLGWTMYFRYSMIPKLAEIDARAEQKESVGE
jgi:hypothetical protein